MAAEGTTADANLDSILDGALLEFDSQAKSGGKKGQSGAKKNASLKGEKEKDEGREKSGDMFSLLFKDMETLLREFEDADAKAETTPSAEDTEEKKTFKSSIKKTLRDLDTATKKASGRADPVDAEKVLDEILDEFEQLGTDEEFVGAIDNMVDLLMGKEFLYQPLRDMNEKYPTWLSENKEKLTDEEYDRYTQQAECIKEILRVYEQEGDKKEKILELLQEIQQSGQPPQDLMKELAPGIDFSPGGLPEIPSLSELQVGDRKCSIM